MHSLLRFIQNHALPICFAGILLSGCSADELVDSAADRSIEMHDVLASGAAAPPTVAGTWAWEEVVVVKGPSDFIVPVFNLQESEGAVMHLTCVASGELALVQNEASFSGSATQTAYCDTKGGQHVSSPPFPPGYDLEGTIHGRSIHFEALVGEGFECLYRGSLKVDGGVAMELNATGGCTTPFEVHPNVSKSVSFDAVRAGP